MGWEQLKQIIDESRKEAEEQAKQLITQCPECAFPQLKKNKNGELLCPICGYRK